MHWVRANRRFGAWCALLAITLQVVLSFGHAHRFDGFRAGLLTSQAIAALSGQQTSGQPAAEAGTPASKPAGLVYEYCAICAVIEMGASAVPTAAPAYIVPAATGKLRFASYAQAAAAMREHLLFQARAPPSV
jgi:hypothetical protein